MNYFLAIDIGASSGRHILGHIANDKLQLEEVYRFVNTQVRKNGHDCWNTDALKESIVAGLKACKVAGKIPSSIGIDTWGVDFVLIDDKGRDVSDAVAYRDARTAHADEIVDACITPAELYARTGIQKQLFNSIYQLAALKREHPEQLQAAHHFLMMPDYLNYFLTGICANEYTNASTTNLVNARSKTWDTELLTALGLPTEIFGELKMPGTVLGPLRKEIADEIGFDTTVILPATHDTGSAYLAVPARDDKAVYLSSGTWSLLGIENTEPITSDAAREANFTNEGGAWYRYRFLKNIMGLWMIQSLRRELNGESYVAGKAQNEVPLSDWQSGKKYSFADLEQVARAATHFSSTVAVDDARFLSPESMIAEIRAACQASGKNVPNTVGEIVQCVYLSLAQCYANAVKKLEEITGKKFTSMNIVGGGSQDTYLNELTAQATGLEVLAGPTEGTAIGNLIIQLIAAGEATDLIAARKLI